MSEHLLSHPMNPNQAMADSLGEQLSALMDGELARDQVRFLLRGVEAQPDLGRRWSNYHLISASLKREVVAIELPADFADRVIGRLDAEAPIELAVPARRVGLGVLRWVGGGAIAAAVAVVALTASRPPEYRAISPAVAAAESSRQLSQPYLPLARPAPITNSPLFTSDAVQPASFEQALPNYYLPKGAEPAFGRIEVYRVPLRVQSGMLLEDPSRAAVPSRQ